MARPVQAVACGFRLEPKIAIDGELVAFDASGRPNRIALARRAGRFGEEGPLRSVTETPVVLVATDLLSLGELDTRTLLGRGLRLLGVDAPSVDPRTSKTLTVHHMLFSSNAYILENLDLRRVSPGPYELIALPLKYMALDAAPVRAVLRDTQG